MDSSLLLRLLVVFLCCIGTSSLVIHQRFPQYKTCVENRSRRDSSRLFAYDEEVDIAIVGAGIGGLCSGAILNTLYGKKVGVYESHYIPGGCAHAFDLSLIHI